MTKVFIGGSRKMSKLNEYVRNRIDKIIERGCTILVGDANGIDKSVQSYLFEINYKNVVIFCAGNECRNNIGHWETRHIRVNQKKKDSDYYSAKDLEMVREADYGFMIWDAKSKGTFVNIRYLLNARKKVILYFSPQKSLHTVTSFDQLKELLSSYDIDYHDLLDHSLKVSQRVEGNKSQQEFDLDLPRTTIEHSAAVESSRLS
jgi:hypothetical protein